MRFEITHDFDIALDALELAVLSPDLFQRIAERLTNIEELTQSAHELSRGVLERVWSYRANVKIPSFAKKHVTKDMLAWDEHSRYAIKTHSSRWEIIPKVKKDWKKYFQAEGTYTLVALEDGRTRRVVAGDIDLKVPVVRQVAERMILNEVKKTFEAEAATLRDLATLS